MSFRPESPDRELGAGRNRRAARPFLLPDGPSRPQLPWRLHLLPPGSPRSPHPTCWPPPLVPPPGSLSARAVCTASIVAAAHAAWVALTSTVMSVCTATQVAALFASLACLCCCDSPHAGDAPINTTTIHRSPDPRVIRRDAINLLVQYSSRAWRPREIDRVSSAVRWAALHLGVAPQGDFHPG